MDTIAIWCHSIKKFPTLKTAERLLLTSFLIISCISLYAQQAYTIIPKKTGKLNKTVIAGLSPSLKALAAFYSAMGGTNCKDLQCELTTALGLGNQGSDAQKTMIQKYFPGDKAANLVVGQDCYLPPAGSSSFSNFVALSFAILKDTIRVNYQLLVHDHGNTKTISGPDIYVFKSQVFKNKKRVLYAWTDK
jgi:hypothetical protein